jgi:hypothetical protein
LVSSRRAHRATGSPPATAGSRREIAKLELSCANSDSPLPYIDLVNEILEHAVAAFVQPPGWNEEQQHKG